MLKRKLTVTGSRCATYVIAIITVIVWFPLIANVQFWPSYTRMREQGALVRHGPLDEAEWKESGGSERQPNLPAFYWNRNSAHAPPASLNATCAPFPPLSALEFHNLYWQTLRTSNGTLQLLSAYADARPLSGVKARILAVYDRLRPVLRLHCQFWYEGRPQPVLTEAGNFTYLWHYYWGRQQETIYHPYIVTCPVPKAEVIPQSVALVERPCDQATNNLRLVYQRPGGARKNVAVCVKALDLPGRHAAARLVEWLELLRLLGADKVIIQKYLVHPTIAKVLALYEMQGFVETAEATLANFHPASRHARHAVLQKVTIERLFAEVVQYNDCFYRHLHEYRYIAMLDIDEVIVPVEGAWKELIEGMEKERPSSTSYHARNVYFFDSPNHNHTWFPDVPKYMHMLQHVAHSLNHTDAGYYAKSFFSTDSVLAVHNHFPIACLERSCSAGEIPLKMAQLQHYRKDCAVELRSVCWQFKKFTAEDRRLWRFKEPLVERTRRVVAQLGLPGDV